MKNLKRQINLAVRANHAWGTPVLAAPHKPESYSIACKILNDIEKYFK